MSTFYAPSARLIWSLASSGLGTSISAAGNSGTIDLSDATDIAVMISVAGITSTPSLNVYLDTYDDRGNLYAQQLKTAAAITAAGVAVLAGGLHAPAAGTYLVLPQQGRVSWTCSGGTATGTEIAVYGR